MDTNILKEIQRILTAPSFTGHLVYIMRTLDSDKLTQSKISNF